EVSHPIEEAVNTVEGLDELRSISTSGTSFIIATFNLNRDIDIAAQDVRDRVAAVIRNLPKDAKPPVISKFNNDSSPVMTVALTASPGETGSSARRVGSPPGETDSTMRRLTEIADKVVRPQLERSAGVGEVVLVGGLQRAVNVWIEPDRLAAYGLSITSVRDALLRQHSEEPGGNVTA